MLKITNTPSRNLEDISLKHYLGLKRSLEYGVSHSGFNKIIKKEIRNRLKRIIIALPSELLLIEEEIYSLPGLPKKSIIDARFKTIFSYSNFIERTLKSKWNSYKLAEELKVNTCLYCNRKYTFTLSDNLKKITRPQFDHFYSQEKHKVLSLSFYNLVPCCSICNGPNLKGTKDLTLHPYVDEYGKEASFTWIPTNYDSIIGRSDQMLIKVLEKPNSLLREKIIAQKRILKTEEIYSSHRDYVQEIILKAHITKGHYFNWLRSLFGQGVSDNDLYRLALGNYCNEDEHDKRVLSKLSFDIAKELDLI
jgi:hypothetical protein